MVGQDTGGEGVTEARVLAALSQVQEPELHKDLVTLNMIRDVKVEDGKVSFTIVLTTPACPLRGDIKAEAEAAVRAIPGVKEVEVKWDSSVPQDRRLTGQLDIGVSNAIAVGSGKGGVGKTTVAVNLAVSLALEGAQVGLLDADIYGPNVPLMMGVNERPRSLDGKKILPLERFGVKLMSMGFLIDEKTPVIWRGPMIHGTLRQFLSDVEWGTLDYLVVDLPPGTGDASLSLAQSIPLTGAVLVTTPQAVSVADVVKGMVMFQHLKVPVLGVIENMSHFVCNHCGERTDIFGSGGGRRVSEEMGIPFLGEVPIDPQVRAGGDEGQPVVIAAPDSPAGQALRQIARELAAKISIQNMVRERMAAY
jgi:ATP-binding protein involved in chromosome partitioning